MKRILTALTILMLVYSGIAWGAAGSILDGFSSKIESNYFSYYSDLPRQELQTYAEFSNLFLDLVDRDFIRLRNLKKMSAVVFTNQSEMRRFLAQKPDRNESPLYGIYIPEHHLFFTYDRSGLGTITHEIMHPVISAELPQTPFWAWEGIPTFFEKFYGYKEGNRLYLKWGYQNPWRINALGERLLTLNLAEIMSRSNDESKQWLVSVFIYRRGKFRSFLDLIREANKKGYETYVEGAFGRPMSELTTDWHAYLQETYARRAQID